MTALIVMAWLSIGSASPSNGNELYRSELSTPAGTAIIVQSAPSGTKPFVRKTLRPDYSILQQESGGNSAIVIQQQSGD